ncbi:MAG: alpha/beta fold hydrolase BchO [Myxococcota bacterium]
MSRRRTDGVDWYFERGGEGPRLLMVHGTGASTHSWRGLIPSLSSTHEVMLVDLPGHGRSGPCQEPSLPRVAETLGALLRDEGFEPKVVVGHSAGAAILLRMAADGLIAPDVVVSFNGAFLPFGGRWGPSFWSPMTRWLVQSGLPGLFARRCVDEAGVRRLVERTGSRLDDEGVEAYRQLLVRPEHVEGALGMMAHWDLRPLWSVLSSLRTPVFLVAAQDDQTVSPSESASVADQLPLARFVRWPSFGHLAHEEDPAGASAYIREAERWAESELN